MPTGRLFEIIQLLRNAPKPLRAQDLAEALEVTKRTIYRDIATLQARRVPIEGAAGVGYVMRAGYDLPPVNFDIDEAEAVTVALKMIARTGDKGLEQAARRAARKLAAATQLNAPLYSSAWAPEIPDDMDLSVLRSAIRSETKLHLVYHDAKGALSARTICPVAMVYYADSVVLAGWCELRCDFRHFRPDRMARLTVLEDSFAGEGQSLRDRWAEQHLDAL